MTAFWISASLMIAAALAFVLPPLVRRVQAATGTRDAVNLAIYQERRQEMEAERAAGALDEAGFAAACAELDRELLHDVGDEQAAPPATPASALPAIAVAVLVPLVAFGAYLAVGAPRALIEDLSPPPVAGSASAGGAESQIPHSVQEMVARLEQRMREHPEDPEGWVMLGRSYAAMNRLEDARNALEEANRRRPGDPLALVSLAEVLAGLQGNRLDGQPIALVEQALELQPDYARALWLAGVHAFNVNDRGKARMLWERLLATPGLSPEAMAQVRDAVEQTGNAPAPGTTSAATTSAPGASTGAAGAAATGASISVRVSLSPALRDRLQGDETLFVFARAANGPRMPLAIARHGSGELPLTVTLDDSMAMAPQMTLSKFDQVVVSARVSRSGSATPSPGDLQGSSAPLAPTGTPTVDIVINEVVQ